MKTKILKIIHQKKRLFNQSRLEAVRELEKMREEANQKEKKEAAIFAMERIPKLQTGIVSAKVVISVLTELEKEINGLQDGSSEESN